MQQAPRILIGAVERPGVGGSATAASDLHRRMLADGYDAHFATILDAADAGAILGRINPQVVVGAGFIAAQRLKQADPNRRTVFLTGTCRQAQDYVTSGRVRDAITLARDLDRQVIRPRILNRSERATVDLCDLVVTHSAQTRDMFARFFPASAGKMYPRPIWFAEWICDGTARWRYQARPFAERDIDALFVASDWGRPEKSYGMVRSIASLLSGMRVHIVGTAPHPIASATHHGFIAARETLFDLFGRARTVVCASHIDASPGILFEAASMGCNVVASRNCGNWELCHFDLLADPFEPEAFAAAIRRSVERKYDDHLAAFLGSDSYRELVDVLTALSQPFVSQAM